VEDADHVQPVHHGRQLHVAPVILGNAKADPLLFLIGPDVGQGLTAVTTFRRFRYLSQQQTAPFIRISGRTVGFDFIV
jgi:hypothetical protein